MPFGASTITCFPFNPTLLIVGLLKALGWSAYALPDQPLICKLPPRPAPELVQEIKSKLGIPMVRAAGDLHMTCETFGFLVGAIGGRAHIELFIKQSLDMLVCGEIDEWELVTAQSEGQSRIRVRFCHGAGRRTEPDPRPASDSSRVGVGGFGSGSGRGSGESVSQSLDRCHSGAVISILRLPP